MDLTPYSTAPPPQNKTSGTMFSPKNGLNTIKINQLHKIICHFVCDYLCATLVHIYNIDDNVIQSEGRRVKLNRKN